jgi:hypothetical protein
MFYLTVVAVIFAIVQTGIVKLPTILDFSNSSTEITTHNKQMKADGK